eukprot:TRINITY_DN21999_c0_g1_i2.p1 TRINITY_DN21999_c0_g1~~TRINITY_DN21999_c0_g1_i2.p1  ORF type:complete len:1326 (+),score=464.92 TRINITY_DN21999_c0_g1_i2:1613-5590(+)
MKSLQVVVCVGMSGDGRTLRIRKKGDAKIGQEGQRSGFVKVTSPLKTISLRTVPKSVKTKTHAARSPVRQTLSGTTHALVSTTQSLLLTEADIEASKREAIEASEKHIRTALLCDMRVQRLIHDAARSSSEMTQVKQKLENIQHEKALRDQENEGLHRRLEELERSYEKIAETQGTVKEMRAMQGEEEDGLNEGLEATLDSECEQWESAYDEIKVSPPPHSLHSTLSLRTAQSPASPQSPQGIRQISTEFTSITLDFNFNTGARRVPSTSCSASSFDSCRKPEPEEPPKLTPSLLNLHLPRVNTMGVIRRLSLVDALQSPFRTPRGKLSTTRENIKRAIDSARDEQSRELFIELHDQFTFAIECGLLELIRDNELETLCLSHAELTDSELQPLLEELRESQVRRFEYTEGRVGGGTLDTFAGLVQSMKHLHVLSFEGTAFEEPKGAGLHGFAASLATLKSLTKLSFSKCTIAQSSWPVIISELAGVPHLGTLAIDGTSLPTLAVQYLSLLVRTKSSLVFVDVSGVGVGRDHIAMTWLMDGMRARHILCEEDTSYEPCKIQVEDAKGGAVALDDGWAALHYAVFLDTPEKVEGLLEEKRGGAGLRDAVGRTPLHLAAMANATACLDVLLQDLKDRDEDKAVGVINYTDDFGMSALQAAVDRCHITCVSSLLKAGATVDSNTLNAAIQLRTDYNKCVQGVKEGWVPDDRILQAPEAVYIANHRGCHKARRVVKEQLAMVSAYAYRPLRAVALREFLPGFFVYMFVLAIITMTAASFSTHFSSQDFLSTKSLRDRMEGIESLHDIKESSLPDIHHLSTIPELWEWSDMVLISMIEEAIHSDGLDVVGGIRIRQVRVRGTPCGSNQMCYGPFNSKSEDTSPFELGGMTWEWEQHDEPATLDPAMTRTYGYGGYTTVLPSHDSQRARERIRALREMGWVNDATRAVFVDLTFFKKNTMRFITCHLLFEVAASGELIYTLELVSIEEWGVGKGLLAVGMAACLVLLVVDEINDVRMNIPRWRDELGDAVERDRWAWARKSVEHILEAWNAADFIIIGLLVAALDNMYRLFAISARSSVMRTGHKDDVFVSFAALSTRTLALRDILGVLVVLSWAKILKYISLLPVAGPAVNATISTVINASTLTFMMLFIVISVSLSLGLHFTLGNKVEDFSSLTGAGLSFFRMVFGDFEVDSFTAHTSVVGVMLFVTCLITANFMLMNILIAVIGVQYEAQLLLCSFQWRHTMVTNLQNRLSSPSPHIHYILPKAVLDSGAKHSNKAKTPPRAVTPMERTPLEKQFHSEWMGIHDRLLHGTKLNSWRDFEASSYGSRDGR